MAISDNNKKFLDGLVEYYIDESKSYKQFASEYTEFSESEMDVAVSYTHLTLPTKA